MTIKPDGGSKFFWFFTLISIPLVIPFVIYLYRDGDDQAELIFFVCFFSCHSVSMLILTFTKAFSTYTLDYIGITQECVFFSRTFKWTDFKYIGAQRLVGRGVARPADWLRCSTVSLPKSMTKDEFEKKAYWRPSKTITISLEYDKGGDELYQKFLSYCGGERDIRD